MTKNHILDAFLDYSCEAEILFLHILEVTHCELEIYFYHLRLYSSKTFVYYYHEFLVFAKVFQTEIIEKHFILCPSTIKLAKEVPNCFRSFFYHIEKDKNFEKTIETMKKKWEMFE